ncbi:MAG: hypothetical protein ABI539_09710, partial [Acidobacteriota bacterium]
MIKFLFAIALAAVCAVPAHSSDPSIWSVNSRSDVLKGDARSVSVDDAGVIRIAPRISDLYKTEQPYIWSSTFDSAGNVYLGTGSDGRIYKVTAGGSGALFADLTELNVTAIVAARSGEIFAATSPDGKVYKIDAAGKPSVYFEPGEKYIWSLALMSDGSLAVGTGESGKIYRVKTANAAAAASLFYDTSETHIISLGADAQGNLYAGTDSNGLVLRFGADGKPFALLDSPLREIHQLAVAPDGTIYALAISESAAAPASTPSPAASPENKTVSAAKPGPATPEPPQKSRYDLTGARSAVYRIASDGGTSVIWSSTSVTGFSVYAHKTGDGVLLGTSDKGRIYSVTNDARETLVLQSDASQISTIFSFGQDLYATTSNQGRLFKFGSDRAAEGIYESAVLDAKSTSGWGRAWWRSTGGVEIQTRSGNTQEPDETWSQWTNVAGSVGGPVES